MVKKIGDSPSVGRTGSSRPTTTVSEAKVGSVSDVKGAAQAKGVSVAGAKAGKITPEQREQLMKIIDEEADKLFVDGSIPEKKKQAIKGAVRMAIDASLVEEDTES